MGDDKKSFWQVFKWAISSILLSVGTVIIGFFLGFVRRKDLCNNGNAEDRIRDNTDKLRETTNGLRENNERLRDFLEGLKEGTEEN